MALTMAQIESLLQQARDAGADAATVAALRVYLLDRAADMDGATRLDAALALLDDAEQAAANTFMDVMRQARETGKRAMADDLNSMSDDEWAALLPPRNDDA